MPSILLLIIIYIAYISLGLPDSLLGSAWPSMYKGLNVSPSYAGIISMIIAGSTIISSLFSKIIIAKLKTGLTTMISVILTAVALFGFSISTNFISLCFWAIPLGLGAGSIDSALNNFVALHYKAKHMNWLHCFWGIGATTGPIILSLQLAHGNPWNAGYSTISIIQFVIVIILIASLPLWKKIGSKEKSIEAKTIVSVKYKDLLKIQGVKPALAAFFCYCTVEQVTAIWGGSYLLFQHGIDSKTAAKWISLYYFGITFGRFICGFMTMKLNNKTMIRTGQIIIILGTLTMLLPLNNYAQLIGLFLIGLGCAPVFPALIHDTPVHFGNENSQSLMGLQMTFAYVGTTFMPPLFGFLGHNISFGLMPIFLGIFAIVMIIMVEAINKKSVSNFIER